MGQKLQQRRRSRASRDRCGPASGAAAHGGSRHHRRALGDRSSKAGRPLRARLPEANRGQADPERHRRPRPNFDAGRLLREHGTRDSARGTGAGHARRSLPEPRDVRRAHRARPRQLPRRRSRGRRPPGGVALDVGTGLFIALLGLGLDFGALDAGPGLEGRISGSSSCRGADRSSASRARVPRASGRTARPARQGRRAFVRAAPGPPSKARPGRSCRGRSRARSGADA